MSSKTNPAIPDFSLVMMIGPSCSGKTTLAERNFAASEIVSSDRCRLAIADDGQDMTATEDAFALLRNIVDLRLQRRRLTVVDATNLLPEHRKPILDIAQARDCPAVAIVMETPLRDCLARAEARAAYRTPGHIVRRHHRLLRQHARRGLRGEGFARTLRVRGGPDSDAFTVARRRRSWHQPDHAGPFDIIGDVHGCYDELVDLLDRLGYDAAAAAPGHPEGRTAIFLGDLTDRGPASDRVLELAMNMVGAGGAFALLGNHEAKLLRHLEGDKVQDLPRTGGDRRAAGAASARIPERDAGIPPATSGPVPAGPGPPGRGARRRHRSVPGPPVQTDPGLLSLRADERGARRMGPARAHGLGAGLPGRRQSGLRTHPDRRAQVGEQRHLPGHGRRLRRPAHRPALSRAGTGFGAGAAGLLRTVAAAGRRRRNATNRIRKRNRNVPAAP